MVAIRNRNTNVPHVFRYPMWEADIFYPAGSLVAYPVESRTDSDQAYFDFYVAKFDVEASNNTPPPEYLAWKVVMSTSTVGDSEVNAALIQLDSDILLLQELIQELIDRDSDFGTYLDSEIGQRIENDSDIQFVKNLVLNVDSELARIEHDSLAGDSDILELIREHYVDSEIRVRRIFFDDDSEHGMLQWNPDEGTLDITLNNEVTLQVGQEQVFYGKAQGAIANGEVVMFSGAQGDHLLFTKADVTIPGFRDEWVIGVATQSLANNEFGYVTSLGKVRELNTNAFAEGSLLYLDPTEPGRLIDSEPTAPLHAILVAAVTRSHNNQGTIFVRPSFGKHLGEHHDVNLTNIQDQDILVWNATLQYWENKPIGSVGLSGLDYGGF